MSPAANIPAHTSQTPTFVVQAAWGLGPLAVPARTDWTNETSFLRQYVRRGGRAHELDVFQATEVDLVMDGRNRRYDATYAGTPIGAANLLAHRRLRVTLQHPDLDRYAVNFDGTNTNYLIANPHNAFPSTALTFEATVMGTGAAAGNNSNETLLSYAVTGSMDECRISNLKSLTVFVKGVSVNTGVDVLGDGDQKTWHRYVAVAWRSLDGMLRVWVNGVLRYTGTLQQGVSITNGGVLVIGQRQTSLGGGFGATDALNGQVRQVRLWNIVRTHHAVYGYMYLELAGTETGLVSYWRCDDNTGGTAADSTAGARPLTLTGATWSTMTGHRTRFDGFIETITPTRVITDQDAPVLIKAVDAISILARFKSVVSPFRKTALDLGPYLMWPLDETNGPVLDVSGNGRNGSCAPGVVQGIPAPLPDADTGLGAGVNGGEWITANDPTVAQFERTQAFSVAIWARFAADPDQLAPEPGKANVRVRICGDSAATYEPNDKGWYMEMRDFGMTVSLVNSDPGNNELNCDGYFDLLDKRWHLVGFTYDGLSVSTSLVLYVDGVAIAKQPGGNVLSSTIVGTNRLQVGALPQTGATYIETRYLCIYTKVLAAADFASLYRDGHQPWRSQRSDVRAGKLLDLLGWPATKRDIRYGVATLAPVADPIGNGLTAIQNIASQLEVSGAFVTERGDIAFDDRYANSFDTPIACVIGDDRTLDDFGYRDFNGPIVDARDIGTDVETQRVPGGSLPNGPLYTASDATSQTVFASTAVQLSGPWSDDQQAREVGVKVQARIRSQTFRVDSVKISADPKNWYPVLSLRLHRDRCTLIARIKDPSNPGGFIGAPISINCWMESISESWTKSGGFVIDAMGFVPDDGSRSDLARTGASALDGTAVLA